jgi:toxin ParE1/3/4
MIAGPALSARAAADLSEIWDYSVLQWGEIQTEIYIRALWQAIELVTATPNRGRACDEIRLGYFKFQIGTHMLFYRLTSTGVQVVRILHSRMDFEQHL